MAGFFEWLGFGPTENRSAISSSNPDAPAIPPRADKPFAVSPTEALGIATVFRAVQIISTSVRQLTLDGYKGSEPFDSLLLRLPNVSQSLGQFLEETAVSMATRGNAYWLKTYSPAGVLINLQVLAPGSVEVDADRNGIATSYRYNGGTYTSAQIQHLKLFSIPGQAKGVGPIQQAQTELRGALDLRDYAGRWFHDSGLPVGGYLATEQNPDPEQAKALRDAWLEATRNREGIPFLGAGIELKTSLITPAEAKWIEAQQFDVLAVTRMFGVPSSLMLASVEGNSQTYQNVSQEWLGFVRFGLMNYLAPIEEAFSALLPAGASARFNVEGLLRSDTTTRYAAHTSALAGGWMTVDEIRAIEGLGPLPKEAPSA